MKRKSTTLLKTLETRTIRILLYLINACDVIIVLNVELKLHKANRSNLIFFPIYVMDTISIM